jgi:dihydroorotate dehydrogenase electron transfer subunit
MTLDLGESHAKYAPGQFVMVDLSTPAFGFRRPFSVYAQPTPSHLTLLYKVVGNGTQQMSRWLPGQTAKVLGPLGNGFKLPKDFSKTLLLGGGIGIAPLIHAVSAWGTDVPLAPRPWCVYGVRTAVQVGISPDLEQLFVRDRLQITTNDGTTGFAGNICQFLEAHPAWVLDCDDALICGPTPMMQAAVALLNKLHPAMRVQLSLEEHMPCGIGACTGCVVGRVDAQGQACLPSKTCVDGPVFEAKTILWQGLQVPAASDKGATCRP